MTVPMTNQPFDAERNMLESGQIAPDGARPHLNNILFGHHPDIVVSVPINVPEGTHRDLVEPLYSESLPVLMLWPEARQYFTGLTIFQVQDAANSIGINLNMETAAAILRKITAMYREIDNPQRQGPLPSKAFSVPINERDAEAHVPAVNISKILKILTSTFQWGYFNSLRAPYEAIVGQPAQYMQLTREELRPIGGQEQEHDEDNEDWEDDYDD